MTRHLALAPTAADAWADTHVAAPRPFCPATGAPCPLPHCPVLPWRLVSVGLVIAATGTTPTRRGRHSAHTLALTDLVTAARERTAPAPAAGPPACAA